MNFLSAGLVFSIVFTWTFVYSLGKSQPCDKKDDVLILDNIISRYDKAVLPSKAGVIVNVELHVQDISSLSELRSDFELDVLFSSIWRDSGLSFEALKTCHSNITLDLVYEKKIWTPNTCIINSKSANIHKSPSSNVMLILYNNGTVWQNVRMRVRGPCSINLRKFPFDTQSCDLVIESYSFNSQKVRLQWYPFQPVTIMPDIEFMELPDFQLLSFQTARTRKDYTNGHWDRLIVTFTFQRRYGFFILQAYIPTLMTIVVAWISFWMDPEEISARATLGISSFLAMILQFGNILKNQPRVSYIKGLDIWMLSGILFMFGTLAELAVISYMQRGRNPEDETPLPSTSPHQTDTGSRLATIHEDGSSIEHRRSVSGSSVSPSNVDAISRKAFPTLFLLFNLFYWIYYLGTW